MRETGKPSPKDPSLSNLSTAGKARPVHTYTCPLSGTEKTAEKVQQGQEFHVVVYFGVSILYYWSLYSSAFFPFLFCPLLNMAHGPLVLSPASEISGCRILGRSIPRGPLARISLPGGRRMRFMVAKLHCMRRNTSDSVVIIPEADWEQETSFLSFPFPKSGSSTLTMCWQLVETA